MIKDHIELVELCSGYYLNKELFEGWYDAIVSEPHQLWKYIKQASFDEHCEREPEDVWWDIIWMAKDLNEKLELGFDMRGMR